MGPKGHLFRIRRLVARNRQKPEMTENMAIQFEFFIKKSAEIDHSDLRRYPKHEDYKMFVIDSCRLPHFSLTTGFCLLRLGVCLTPALLYPTSNMK